MADPEPPEQNNDSTDFSELRRYMQSDEWLEELTGSQALQEIDNAEYHVEQLLGDLGEAGASYRQTSEYTDGIDFLHGLRARHSALAQAEPVIAVGVPAARVVGTVEHPLGIYGKLLRIVSDDIVKEPRHFKVLVGGLRGEAMKADDEVPWKEAGLALYNRHKATNPAIDLEPFDECWAGCHDRRIDGRVIGHYARISNGPGFLSFCRVELFPALEEKTHFTEVESRDFFMMACSDNLVSVQDVKGTAIWWMKRWRWDSKGATLAHMVMTTIQNLYHDLLTCHRQKKEELIQEEGEAGELSALEKKITQTAKALAAYGNQQNKNVTTLIQNQLNAHCMEIDPFDEDRYLYCFTNKVFNHRTGKFQPHFKFDYMVRNCGREWREPTVGEVEKICAVISSIQPNLEERKSLLSILRSALTGVRPELFIILTGGGRNGKSLLVEWLQYLLGAYCRAGHLSLITKASKAGPNTEVRELHKAFAIIFSEPEEDAMEALRLSEIKKYTGNEMQNGRGLYDSDSITRIFATIILECNLLPVILGDKGESARERILILDFPMTFTDKQDKLEANPDTYRPLDKTLKYTDFKEKHYCALFQYLVSADEIKDTPIEDVFFSKQSLERASAYLDNNDFIPSWVAERYRKTPNTGDTISSFVSIKYLFALFKDSDQVKTFSKREQRLLNETKFRAAIAKSNVFKPLYREARKVRLSDAGYNSKDGLINIEVIGDEGEGDGDVVAAGDDDASSTTSSTQATKRARMEAGSSMGSAQM